MSTHRARERIARIASRQHGRVSFAQLRWVEASSADIQRWLGQGYLTKVLPKVYAVGHTAPDRYADLWAAVLYAGPNAAISHATAAHLRGLIDFAPTSIEVSTPREKVRSLPGRIHVYARRDREREKFDGVPTTLLADTLLDLAATTTDKVVSRAIRQLDRRGELDLKALDAVCGRGRRGSQRLRNALKTARPAIGYTNSELEQLFLEISKRWNIPEPRCNVVVAGILVDAYWPQYRLVVEIDGCDDHGTVPQMRHDRANELTLRAHGLTVVRYDWMLLKHRDKAVRTDLLAQLKRAAPLHPA
jgi:very-short-patch-repair endonuclease